MPRSWFKKALVFSAVGLLLLGLAQPAAALCDDVTLKDLPILARGRVKPLVVHAEESLKLLLGKRPATEPTALYCKIAFHLPYEDLFLRVDHVELRRLLNLADGEKTVSLASLQAQDAQLSTENTRLKAENRDTSSYGKALTNLLFRLRLFQDMDSGADWMIPMSHAGTESDWITLNEFRASHVIGDPQEVIDQLKQTGQDYLARAKTTVPLELRYHRVNFITHKVWLSFLGLALVFLTQKKNRKTRFWIGGGVTALLLGLTFVDIAWRVMISGRGPVTNMYETILWVGMGVTLFATVLAFVKDQPLYFLFGLTGMLLTCFMNRFAISMVDPYINPLVPVLRDNFWLSTHVTTVTISYAAFGLSWLIANAFMLRRLFGKTKGAQEQQGYNDLAYAAIKIGVVLLATGIILGGVWADYSWGRFWGWDPKETWALIALLIYVAILHGRYAGWITHEGFLPATALAYLSVLMCWFGVNYILASGLHSYGFSQNGTFFLLGMFATQIALFAAYVLRNLWRPLSSN